MTERPQPVLDERAIEQALLERERARRDALVSSDVEALADLLAEDLVHVHTTGIVQDKAALLGHAGVFLQFYEVERGPLLIRPLSPGVAVMTGTMTNTVGKRGSDEKVTVAAFVTQVWVWRDARWQIASFHAVRTPEGAAQ